MVCWSNQAPPADILDIVRKVERERDSHYVPDHYVRGLIFGSGLD